MEEPRLEFDRSLLGREFPAGSFEVTEEMVGSYCRAVGETAPIHTDAREARRQGYRDVVAPPTIVNLFVRALGRPASRLSFKGLRVHAGQSLEVLAPIVAGDRLEARSSLKEVYAKTGRTGTMAFEVWETSLTNQEGRVVARARESFMARP